ncbi:MAG: hypothetical protein DDT31_00613 [Syntrophomonadaceae bacterium]|nr:hypothetical protein [Bacillota bacterium]
MQISFKSKKNPEVRTAHYNFPETLDELVARFGELNVYDNAITSYVITLQGLGRRNLNLPDEEIQELFTTWDPSSRAARTKMTPEQKINSMVDQLSQTERVALLERLRASA